MIKVHEIIIRVTVVAITLTLVTPSRCPGQADTVRKFMNTIRVNVTNPMIFSTKCNIFGYERVIRPHQTISLGVGRFILPKFKTFAMDSIGISNQYHDKGFNISIDYRFYLKKENKFNAPRGVYLGPYYSYNYFSREITWDLNTSTFIGSVNSKMSLTANLVGVQMGYQFVLWNRMSLDLILMGPGLWFFNRKADFSTTLSAEDEAALLDKINQAIQDKFPGSDLIVKTGSFEKQRSTSTSTMGFRYMINIGFRF